MVNAVDTVGSYIEMPDIDDIRKRAVAEVDASGLAADFRLFSFVAGPKALSQVGGDGIALRALAFDMMECATYACKDDNSAFTLIGLARDLKDQMVAACVQDFRGQL
ncbi:MAG: hypothetical protein B7Z04_12600 [Rhodobacterales bacterium 32-66-9]|nr:MAG: hypothetical protein B7Z04_12600 [Rhodobacterales bacterium 32-66-9]